MRIRFIAGQVLPLKCRKCDAVRKGRVYRDLYEWRARLECGHERQLGTTKPLDVLEEEGLVNMDEVMDKQSQEMIENMTDPELEAWKKKVKQVSTRNRTMY